MFKSRVRRLTAVAASALLALMLVGPQIVSASTPGWSLSNTTSLNPSLVKVGSNAAWRVEIDNNGTSNISALYLGTQGNVGNPTYIGTVTYNYPANVAPGPQYPCNPVGSGPLYCAFGNLPSGGSIVISVVAFSVPSVTPTWGFSFAAYGNGNTPSDKGGNSHGDTLLWPVSVNTTTDPNYGGGYSIDTNPVSNAPLSKNNLQSETVNPPTNLIQVTIQDGLACSDTWCSTGFGDVMRLNVDKGSNFANGIKLVITISGKLVPGGATTSNIDLIHLLDGGLTTVTINQRCDGTTTLDAVPGGPECLTVTKVGSNFQIVAYLLSNGQIRLF